jgi:formate hydrogenlyase subunit 6/NADH:ubiquinone oxidoreductase subunit I
VYQYLTGRELRPHSVTSHLVQERYRRERGYESIRRLAIPVCPPEQRFVAPDVLVEIGYNREQAMREASRCLDCGVTPVFDGSRCVLCGGCVDVCPTSCLKLIPLSQLADTDELRAAIAGRWAPVKTSQTTRRFSRTDRVRCAACAMRCPVDAIAMERVSYCTTWRTT